MTDLLADVRAPWHAEAACFGADPELFFPGPYTPQATIAEALAICEHCPVRARCLEFAVEHNECGIWGGTTHRERMRIMRREAAHDV